jgi:D-glycero-alpha-D-manno-heptose-7-phosphate kinase
MILARSPFRITLGGGGTDLASYYEKYGGFLIAAGINKYCSILLSKRFKSNLRLSYSEMEIKDNLDDIRHPIFREALRYTGLNQGLEIHSVSDVPAGSGLGSSSCFTVTLLNALHAYKREYLQQGQLAEEACHIEIDVLKSPIGKQDQYMAAYGGLTCLNFDKSGVVRQEPLRISDDTLDKLEHNLVYFYTGIEREANLILEEQKVKTQANDHDMLENLHMVKNIGLETKKVLEIGNVDSLGELFHAHWQLKKQRSGKMSNPQIDEWYELAIKNGASGGKVMGAGGGGFFVFYTKERSRLIQAMTGTGLKFMKIGFDFEGTKILVNA